MDEIANKQRSLNRICDKLRLLEHDDGNAELVRQFRLRAQNLADEIKDLEKPTDA